MSLFILDDETVSKFKSDFRIVADYFVQIRKNHEYVPSAENMQHVEEVLNLMAAVSGDRRFEAAQNDIKERKITKMEDWLTRALDDATEKGIEKGMDRGIAKKFVFCVDSLMKNEGYSKERACSVLDSTVDEYEDAKKLLTRETAAV